MLQFLKKPGTSAPVTSLRENGVSPGDHLVRIQSAEEACLGGNDGNDVVPKSRLFLCLPDILGDQNCLCYFLQFMEAEDAVPLIKFWLAVENFKLSAQTMTELQQKPQESQERPPTNTLPLTDTPVAAKGDQKSPNCHQKTSAAVTLQEKEKSKESEQELRTNCDIEDRPLTDDEKSEIIQDKRSRARRRQKQNDEEGDQESSQPPPSTNRTKRNSQFQTTVATDAIKIFEKFLCTNSESSIGDLPATIHSKISLSLCNCDSDDLVSPFCFEDAQKFVLDRMEREQLRRFIDSEFYCQYCVEILTSDELRLYDLLYSESALFYFMEFLEQEQCRDYLDFWMSATNFRRHSATTGVDACPVEERRTDAMVLYEKYFSLQATTNSLNFSDTVRSQVEERICSPEEEVLVTSFDLPIRIVERFFEDAFLQKFLASELFYKHVSELMNRSQVAAAAASTRHPRVMRTQSLTKEWSTKHQQQRRHKRTNSDGTGDVLRRTNSSLSVSSQNTLLAMESPAAAVKKVTSSDLQIDSRLFYSADLLWKRCQTKQQQQQPQVLSFGRVNALGRFERDWDEGTGAEEKGQQSAGSRLKKAVKKLVHLPEDKVQEELAWQVAEMIIKDVTDVTMNGMNGAGSSVGVSLGKGMRKESIEERVVEEVGE